MEEEVTNDQTIQIGSRTITARELTVREIKKFWNELLDLAVPTEETLKSIEGNTFLVKHWAKCIQGIDLADLEDLRPSAIGTIYKAFERANEGFFLVALKAEADNPFISALLLSVKKAVMDGWLQRSSGLLKEGTPESGITDSPGSESA